MEFQWSHGMNVIFSCETADYIVITTGPATIRLLLSSLSKLSISYLLIRKLFYYEEYNMWRMPNFIYRNPMKLRRVQMINWFRLKRSDNL